TDPAPQQTLHQEKLQYQSVAVCIGFGIRFIINPQYIKLAMENRSEPNSVKESNSQASTKGSSNDPPSTVSQSRSDVIDHGHSQTSNIEPNQRKKSSTIPDREPIQSTKASIPSTTNQAKLISGDHSQDKPSPTNLAAPSTKSTAPVTDLIDGALSDFEGSDLSDLNSSSSSASASEQDSGDSEDSNIEDSTSDTSKSNDEDEDESMDDSSVSDDSGPRSIPRHKKGSISKNRSQSKHRRRRIESDSSNGEEEREVIKRKPGRPPKLKKHPTRSATVSFPTSPVSPMLSAQTKKSGIEADHQQNNKAQPKKKVKQPDFTNVGKRDRSGRTQLFKYTALGDLETCRKLIEAGAEVNDRDYAEWTPLHEACVTGHEKVAELLIQHKADVNARGGQMDTPLHDAAQNGHIEVVKLLLSNGANVVAKNAKGVIPIDVADEKEVIDLLHRRQALVNMLTGKNQAGQTILHRACSSGSYNNVVELLNQGADINVQDNAQWTPLHEAALSGHTKVVELLLSRGANPNARGHGNDTALHDSAQNGHLDVVRLLLEYGADPDYKNSKGEKACDVTEDDDILDLLKTGAKGTKKPTQYSTGSITSGSQHSSHLSKLVSSSSNHAAKRDTYNGCKEGSIDVNMSDDGRSASEERPPMSRDERKMQQLLSTIRMQEQMEERKKAKKRLAKRESDDDGDDIDHDSKPVQSRSSNSTSSIWKQPRSNGQHSKTSSNKPSIKNGSRTRSLRSEDRDDSGSEPEKYRQSRRSTQRSTGDRHRADHRSKDSFGRSQLHQGAESGDIEMVGTLLEAGAERDPKDHKGLTPLHLAAKAGNTEVLVLLLAYNCNVNAQDNDKSTALHEAVRNHHVEAVRLLLQNNAHPNLRDSHKRTCYDLSTPKDNEIRALLKSSIEQAEFKSKERTHGSPKYKERKTSRQSDSDEPIKIKKKDSDKNESEEKKHHSRNNSTSGTLSKSTSMSPITAPLSVSMPSGIAISTSATTNSTSNWKYSSEDSRDDTSSPLKKQKLHSQRTSGSGSNAQDGSRDVDMRTTASSKKRREADRQSDGYGSKLKIKKEREEEIHNPRISNISAKLDEIRRVSSLPSFSKDITNGSSSAGNTNNSKLSRHSSKPSLSSSIKTFSSPGNISGSSIASISPPLTDTSSSPPPASAPTSITLDPETQKSRKRSSQIFSSSSGYQKFADELKQGSLGASSTSQHHRQRSTGSIPSRPLATTSSAVQGSATVKSEETLEIDMVASRKKAKTNSSDSVSVTYGNGKDSAREAVTAGQGYAESSKDFVDIKKVKEEIIDDHVPSKRSLQDAGRYLPLYTVQLPSDCSNQELSNANRTSQQFSVVDRQVQLLLGLTQEALYRRYPYLQRRSINKREKARLWSPLSSMVSDRCAAAVKLNFEALPVECQFSSPTNAATAMSRLKEHEKQKFLGCELYFIQLEDVLDLIRRDYPHLNESMMTITVDIGYDDEFETGMEVEDESITVKAEEMEDVKPKSTLGRDSFKGVNPNVIVQPSSNGRGSTSISTTSTPAPPIATPSGHMHKLMRVPAKMATKAMFKKEMQFHSS
ncbi:hypothetical protein BGZ76_003000, partial [Entomortierella beljakovae]